MRSRPVWSRADRLGGGLQQVWLNPSRTALVCALFLACFACRGDAQRGDVLLLSVDTLRPDHLGLYGYERATSPNLDRFMAGVEKRNPGERFLDTYRRTGPNPFRERLYDAD